MGNGTEMIFYTKKAVILLFLSLLIFSFGNSVLGKEADMERSVVRIINYAQRGDWYSPWNTASVRPSSGSGFVIDGGVIMTNAHVVSDSKMLIVYFQQDPTPYEAQVVAIGHDCDLALIKPVNAGILDGIPSMSLGGLPALRSTVETYGYPGGGQRISSTKGIVSRIELNRYMHSGVDSHLAVQTDAAINPGNSGGPVIQNERVVGVAFQHMSKMENISLFIPTEVVAHFLSDLEDGVYDGYPDLGIQTVNMHNPAARGKAGMGKNQTGVRVDWISPDASAVDYLVEGDVILAAEGHDIANDGTVDLGGLRLGFSVLIDRNQVGDTTELSVLRKGERIDVTIPMKVPADRQRTENVYDRLPRYFVYAGLVFIPLNRESIQVFYTNAQSTTNYNLLYEYRFRQREQPEHKRDESVILLRRLDHPVNADMAWYKDLVVDNVNGRSINRLEDLIEAIETNQDRFHVLGFGYHDRFGVLEREEADRAHKDILKQYAIPKDRRL